MSNVQYLLITIVRNLTILSLTLCTAVMFYVWTIVPFMEALSFVVVLMVAAIPMAMEIVTTTTLALGSKELSKKGAIVTRLAAIEDMAGMAILCSDKTGTLTLNEMHILGTPVCTALGRTNFLYCAWPPWQPNGTSLLVTRSISSCSDATQIPMVWI